MMRNFTTGREPAGKASWATGMCTRDTVVYTIHLVLLAWYLRLSLGPRLWCVGPPTSNLIPRPRHAGPPTSNLIPRPQCIGSPISFPNDTSTFVNTLATVHCSCCPFLAPRECPRESICENGSCRSSEVGAHRTGGVRGSYQCSVVQDHRPPLPRGSEIRDHCA